ncbi:MAG: aldehyde dehydrogenase family protein [Alcanivorax sp.]|nr:aldehyde dehydrogenase family protein [Alcanivorax sp.]MAY11637.1 aldehyde dehydrogenase family protein [Alcanivorax sp.]MBI53053.1 aldehyde dehydrogenase family protein [Alcanivorax sp.]HCE38964.1 aldehyde dehydrogenase family protein [Alcanivorax sp.]|tara:strand:+ start:25198 stop:26625 length:1428 start_codon:yes stop_codon:yes gene_type:complete
MSHLEQFYINGRWAAPSGDAKPFEVINPATEASEGTIHLAGRQDVDVAIQAARDAFDDFAATPLDQRLQMLNTLMAAYQKRLDDMADAISREMGAPRHGLAAKVQAPMGLGHIKSTLEAAKDFEFEQTLGRATVRREPAGVAALITPWNWPMNQVLCKVAPAIAAGCTMVLKPSEFAPLSAMVLAEIIDDAGLPAGVFNMIYGDGAEVGPMLSSDPRVDMVSLTGSTRAGASVSKEAADTFKRVSLELGGKSANIILPDADFQKAVGHGVQSMMNNTGQSCNAPSRMLVPADKLGEAEAIAAQVCEKLTVGDPRDENTKLGPIANERQFKRVQSLIEKGQQEGAKLVCGGTGKPEGLDKGFYARPTVFSEVNNDMLIAREEIFGPVLVMIPYQNVDEAVAIANDSDYGLSGYVYGATINDAKQVAARLRTGMVHLNGAQLDLPAPFGGYKHSGIGREWGVYGLEEFLETKSVFHP